MATKLKVTQLPRFNVGQRVIVTRPNGGLFGVVTRNYQTPTGKYLVSVQVTTPSGFTYGVQVPQTQVKKG